MQFHLAAGAAPWQQPTSQKKEQAAILIRLTPYESLQVLFFLLVGILVGSGRRPFQPRHKSIVQTARKLDQFDFELDPPGGSASSRLHDVGATLRIQGTSCSQSTFSQPYNHDRLGHWEPEGNTRMTRIARMARKVTRRA